MFHSTTYFPVHLIELHAKVLGTNTTCFNNNNILAYTFSTYWLLQACWTP